MMQKVELTQREIKAKFGEDYFGYYSAREDTIFIRKDLYQCEKDYVYAHEYKHKLDSTRFDVEGVYKKEERANVTAFKQYPIGGILIFFRTIFSAGRLETYKNRILENK